MRVSFLALLLFIYGVPPLTTGTDDKTALELGKEVFTEIAEPQCGLCHVLADAGAAGKVGPSLDDQQPTEEDAKLSIMEGGGVMPPYVDLLTPEQIDAVAKYVSSVAGKTQ